MDNKIIIAAAGSGKTTYIVEEALKITENRVLITTFTDTNALEIKKKIIKKQGYIPSNIIIQPWFTFLLHHGVRPFHNFLIDEKIQGLILVNSQSAIGVPECKVKQYYFHKDMKIYSDKIAKFTWKVNEKSNGFVIDRISRVFPNIFIDEVQDMAGYDLDIMHMLFKSSSKILLVGDPRQVTYHTHNEAKNRSYKDGKIVQYIRDKCRDINVEIDSHTLNTTHRNCRPICDYANAIYSDYEACLTDAPIPETHAGIFLVKPCDVEQYLKTYHPTLLRDKSSVQVQTNQNCAIMNFGAAKGITFNRVLIYPTKPMIDWMNDHSKILKFTSRAKFYVAVTRAKYSVAIVLDYNDETNINGVQKFHC